MRQTPRSTTATASSGPGSVIAAPHSRPRSTSSSPPRPGQKTRKALASGPRLQPFPGLAHDDVGVEVGQQADPAVLAGWRRGVAGQGPSRDAVHFDLLHLAVSASQDHSVRGDRARRTGRRIVARVRLPRSEQCGSGTRPAAAACTSSPVMLTGCGCWPSVPTGRGWLPPATTALYGDGTRRPAPPARPDGKPDARRNEKSAACRRRLTCPELISPSSHSGEDGFRRLVHPDRICRHHSPGNGDGQWPKLGISGCSQPGAVAFEPDYAGQRDAGVLDSSRGAAVSWRRKDAGKTPYHLASHLILKSRIEIETEIYR